MSNLSVPLLGRRYLLQVGKLEISQLRVVFSVVKNLTKDPNRADVKVYNLSPDSRSQFAIDEPQDVILLAGYELAAAQIFVGSMARAMSYNDGTDWITEFRAGDGLDKVRLPGRPVSVTNTSAKDLVKSGLASVGIPAGNFDAVMAGKDPKKMKRFASLKAAYDYIQDLARGLELDMSIQDGVAQFIAPGKIVSRDIVELSPRSGLVGSPEMGHKGRVKARALIQPRLQPGHGVRLEAKEVKGLFRIETVHFTGDTFGQAWYAEMELSSLDPATQTIPETNF